MTRVLFVASEAFPLIKTGGLADVAGSLPEALRLRGADVRLLLPAYGEVLATAESPRIVAGLEIAGESLQVLETLLPGTSVTTWLLQHPSFSERPGDPYHDGHGQPWQDNAERFALLSHLAAAIACGETDLDWRADVLHCNDWHTGPAVPLAQLREQRPRTVFTIHNLAHMGLCDRATFERLHFPEAFWHGDSMEFYDQCSFIKGGLAHADYITTVSPGYAREICESPGGMGLEGLLSHRRERLVGILNGIDLDIWNPATDPLIDCNYDAGSLADKERNKTALQTELGLQPRDDLPLLGFVGRLAEQKGLELLLPILDDALANPAQLVLLGTGEPDYEQQLQALAERWPGNAAVILAYNESMAHKIEAAADLFLMPSLFEPCGLNQLYSLRYGTLPLVRRVGGLADTVVDASAHNLEAGSGTGFVFDEPSPVALLEALQRAMDLWHDKANWRQLQRTAMAQDFSWERSANQYLELYRSPLPS